MNRVCTWITIAYFIVAVFAGSDLEQGYYWREFKKEIPKDAFVAVVGKDGKNNYIGKTIHSLCKLIIPGLIRQGTTEMQYEWDLRRRVADKKVQILCTHHPEDFEWLPTNVSDIVNLLDRHLVSGGVEYILPGTFIGRVTSEKEALIGRAIYVGDKTDYKAFYSATSNATFTADSNFEVLAYNPPK